MGTEVRRRYLFVDTSGGVTLSSSPYLPCNCSDLMCPSSSQPVIPGLTRDPVIFTTSNSHYHWHFCIPPFGDLCVTFRDSSESENPECAQIRGAPSP